MQHPFSALAPEYAQLLATVNVTKTDEVDAVARKLLDRNHRPRLEPVCNATDVPLPLWASLCERESGCRFDRNPAQGDPLSRPSTHVPVGRPKLGAPPNDHFPVTYEYAAIDAINYDHLNDNSAPWTMTYACWKGEAWNGFGPRNHGIHTGYLWGGTNHYTRGKYIADGVWDPSHADVQLGIVPVMLRMIALDQTIAFGPPGLPAPFVVPVPQPVPIGVGGGEMDTRSIQHALNQLGFGPLLEDGSYGRRTREAVRAFQRTRGLWTDGLAGPKTHAAFDAAMQAAGKV